VIVLDASAAVAALLNDGQARRLVAEEALHAPHLIDAEVVSALRRLVAAGTLSDEDGHRCVETWSRTGLIRYAAGPLLSRVWELRGGLSAYDAMYVALAEGLECALVTVDARLSRAPGSRCTVTAVPD
jgi:predicted nucleic acid-binding protein